MSAPTTGLSDLIAGHAALDLVNTVSWRHDPDARVDRVPDLTSFLTWAARAGMGPFSLPEGAGTAADDGAGPAMERVHALRENAHAVLVAHARGMPVPSRPLRELHEACAEAMAAADPLPSLPLRWACRATTPQEVPNVVVAALFDLLTLNDLDHLCECAGDGCGWLYLDRSRNHSRRWCSSADCGNRTRVRRFAAKERRVN